MDSYREHLDHEMGRATEHQNALAVSQLTRKPDDSARIQAALNAGKFVVVHEATVYCGFTDGIVGSDRWLSQAYDTRAEAEARMRRDYEDLGENHSDLDVYILPPAAPPAPVFRPLPADPEEIPF